jgi:hypothetical protein
MKCLWVSFPQRWHVFCFSVMKLSPAWGSMAALSGGNMKRTMRVLVLLAAATVAPHLHAGAGDEALCRGGYAFTLMTPAECRSYVREVKTLRAKGETRALDELTRQHEALLRERAAACPCIDGQPVETPRQQVALNDPSC